MTASALLASALPAHGDDTVRLSGRAFGTVWTARLRGRGDVDGLLASLAADLQSIDRAMSPFRPDSALSRLNRGPAGRYPVEVDFRIVTEEALRVAELTGGAFDPSVGPDVGRFGFGPIGGDRVGSHAGFATDKDAIIKHDPRLTLDLCGIAKGFALDRMAAAIARAGYGDFVVELGGEVIASGTDRFGAPWQVGISDAQGGLHERIDAKGLAVATSGDAVNAYTVQGRRYSHIIDPATDRPVTHAAASVTVLGPTGMTADALATALMVMGPSKGMDFAQAQGLPILFLVRGPAGLEAVSNAAFDGHRLT